MVADFSAVAVSLTELHKKNGLEQNLLLYSHVPQMFGNALQKREQGGKKGKTFCLTLCVSFKKLSSRKGRYARYEEEHFIIL